ncbi:MAG: DUF4012 domain-containing protein [Candidatus Colwellbacteria bacterium]
MKRPVRKNIDQTMADVRHPGTHPKKKEKTQPKRVPRRLVTIGAVGALVILFSTVLILDIGGGASSIYKQFQRLADGIRNFDTSLDYFGSLNNIEDELEGLDERARVLASIPKLKQVPEIINGLLDIVSTARVLGEDFNSLGSRGLSLSFSGEGEELIRLLASIRDNMKHLRVVSEDLQLKAAEFGVTGHNLNLITADLVTAEEGLSALVSFLDIQEPRRIVLLFLNPSELRPNGGFAGSYGELTLQRGSVESLEVNDIYYPDKFLSLRVIPPPQLQSITPNWGARDTGWFFDFSKSSENLIDYLEASSIYGDDVRFDGVIALNVKVIEDLLKLTGPIDVPEYDMQLDSENFLRELQQEVQSSNVPGENPKRVLQFAAPRLIEALGTLEESSRGKLIEVLALRARNKDVQMYFKDSALDKLLRDLGVDGRPYEIGDDFSGDYLALVNTNIAGGKTDIFVDQYVTLRSEIASDGVVTNDLTVTRYHKGQNEPERWYNRINQNFFKVFTHPDSRLQFISGGENKEIRPLVNYTSLYSQDADLAELESTRTILQIASDGYAESYVEAHKRVFASWFNLDPGERRSLQMRWRASRISLRDSQRFTFVVDKQSGSEMDFDYALVAPEGYYWLESGRDIFRYNSNSLPARVVIELTLKKK